MEERANLSAFRTFDRFVLIWICRFPLPLGVWEGLRFVIMALFILPFFSREAIKFYSIHYSMRDYYVNSRFRFGIIPEFDV